MNSFIDSGAGLVLSMVHSSPFNIKNKQFIIVRLCTDDKLFMRVNRLMTNRLHSKAVEHSYVIA